MRNTFVLKRILWYISYWFRHSHRNGHGIHSPFLFGFTTEVLGKKKCREPLISRIEEIRKSLLKSKEFVFVEDYGAGSAIKNQRKRKISEITRYSSIDKKYGCLLYYMVGFLHSEIVIELGTCLGFSSMYLAAANKNNRVYTIEGSSALHEVAKKNYELSGIKNIIPICGNFNDLLPEILNKEGRFDLMFIDGNHRKEAVIQYFYLCLQYVDNDSVIIFDDIRWSKGMYEAWREICKHERVTLSLDLFRTGIVFFSKRFIKQHFEIYY